MYLFGYRAVTNSIAFSVGTVNITVAVIVTAVIANLRPDARNDYPALIESFVNGRYRFVDVTDFISSVTSQSGVGGVKQLINC